MTIFSSRHCGSHDAKDHPHRHDRANNRDVCREEIGDSQADGRHGDNQHRLGNEHKNRPAKRR